MEGKNFSFSNPSHSALLLQVPVKRRLGCVCKMHLKLQFVGQAERAATGPVQQRLGDRRVVAVSGAERASTLRTVASLSHTLSFPPDLAPGLACIVCRH